MITVLSFCAGVAVGVGLLGAGGRRLRRQERGGLLDLTGALDDIARRRRSWP